MIAGVLKNVIDVLNLPRFGRFDLSQRGKNGQRNLAQNAEIPQRVEHLFVRILIRLDQARQHQRASYRRQQSREIDREVSNHGGCVRPLNGV